MQHYGRIWGVEGTTRAAKIHADAIDVLNLDVNPILSFEF